MLKIAVKALHLKFKFKLFIKKILNYVVTFKAQFLLMDKYRQFLPACGLLKTLLNKQFCYYSCQWLKKSDW